MNASPEYASFARLVESLRPWLDQMVVVGGWAHRLYRLHTFAQQLRYEPLATLDADIALPTRFNVTGDEIYRRLASNGFKAEFLGHHKPPAAHYRLTDPGIEFYAEFVAPLAGSAVTRRGKSKATQSIGGISLQNLRYVEVLLARPWRVTLSASNGFPLANDTRVQIANPVSFLVQKILIHGRRNRDERAKDILYMHDTIEIFAARIDELRAEWTTNIRPVLHVNGARTIQRAAASLFGAVTDPIRSASRIVQGRALPPEVIRETCSLGFVRVFGEREREE
ncbi:MAG TPA: GSU2403 family nucleotidyltransferase fold protein [Terriglobales bacterium]|nr:GSU2403 family nucleotidyltransferase fold protein [Terriglobales bacterium]